MKNIEEINLASLKKIIAEKKIPDFSPGDIVKVGVRITRVKEIGFNILKVFVLQKNRDLNSSFTVRKISFGEGVERTFALYSPIVDSIKVTRSGKVKRAKLYYLRDRTGKSARIAEKIKKKIGIEVETKPEQVTDENVAKSNDNIKEEEISSEKNLALEPEAKKKDIKETTVEKK